MPDAGTPGSAGLALWLISLAGLALLAIVVIAIIRARHMLIAFLLALLMIWQFSLQLPLWQQGAGGSFEIGWDIVLAPFAFLVLQAAGLLPTLWLVREGRPLLAAVLFVVGVGIGPWLGWYWHQWISGSAGLSRPTLKARKAIEGFAMRFGSHRRYAVAADTILAPARPRSAPARTQTAAADGSAGSAASSGGLDWALAAPIGLAFLAGLVVSLMWIAQQPGLSGSGGEVHSLLQLIFAVGTLVGGIAAVAAVDQLGVPARNAGAFAAASGAVGLLLLSSQADTGFLWMTAVTTISALTFTVEPIVHGWLGREGRASAFAIGLVYAAGFWASTLQLDIIRYGEDPSSSLTTPALLIAAAALVLGFLPRNQGGRPEGAAGGLVAGLRNLVRDPLVLRLLAAVAVINLASAFGRFGLLSAQSDESYSTQAIDFSTYALSANVGAIAGGWLADRAPGERSYVIFSAAVLAIGGIVLAAMSLPVASPGFIAPFAAGLTAGAWYGPIFSLFQRRAVPGGRTLAAVVPNLVIVAVNLAFAILVGAMFGGSDPSGLASSALPIGAGMAIVAAGILFFARDVANCRPLTR